jgi:S-sulfo-L-cysteine synthase (3-phospho-L-serine-dependent)
MYTFGSQILSHGMGDALPTFLHRDGITCMAFHAMKSLPAFYCICEARRKGHLRKRGRVIESSSGTFAYGLARICHVLNHPLTIVSESLESWLVDALKGLGTEVELVQVDGDRSQVQQVRLARLHELRQQSHAYWPQQYHNPDNAHGYVAAAEMLVHQYGVPQILVCPVGSGGNSSGLITLLRALVPETGLVGVDCFGSVTFGLPVSERELGGIGNSIMPRCVRHTSFDEVHWINAAVAIAGTRRIAQDGLGDFGLTSGAAYMVARWLRRRHQDAHVAVVFPDRAFRYLERIAREPLAEADNFWPRTVHGLAGVEPPWTRLAWGRKTLSSWTGNRHSGSVSLAR